MSVVQAPPTSPSDRPSAASSLAPWLFAIGAAALSMALRAVLQPVLGDALPFVVAAPVLALVALRHGAGPAILTTFLCVGWVAVPGLVPKVAPADWPFRVGGFLLSAIAASLICAQFRRPLPQTTASSRPGAGLTESPLVRWLRAAVWGAALVPLVAYASACWWGYQKAFADAHASVVRANAVVAEHAVRTFAAAQDIADRVQELIAVSDTELRGNATEIDRRLRDIAIGRPAVIAITAWDANGRLLVSSLGAAQLASVSIADHPPSTIPATATRFVTSR